MITESGVTVVEIAAARKATAPPANQAMTRADIILTLLWSMEHRGGRIGVVNWDLLAWLNDFLQRFGRDDERLGGAPGSMIHTLTKLCREPNVAIFTVFHSEKQASVYPAGIRFLTADAPAVLGTVEARDYHWVRSDRPADPDVRNYPLEYPSGEGPSWGPDPAERVAEMQGPDRLICTAPYLHFDADGRVRAGDTPAIIERIFQFPGLTDAQRDTCASAAGEAFPYMTLAGLQGAGEKQQPDIERDLGMLLGKVTIHIELSGARNLPWLRKLIPRYISSVGINDDELPEVCEKLTGKTMAVAGKYDSIWAFYEDARALAATLDLPRLYVHSHIADLALRRLPVSDKALADEILADLFAKRTVIEWLKQQMPSDLHPGIGPKRDGLESLTTFMSQVSGLSGKTLLEWLADTAFLARKGYFRVTDDYAVAVIPVAWFYGKLPQTIITTGAGDRTSVASFIQSCFTQPRPLDPA